MKPRPEIPYPDSIPTRQILYELIEAAVTSIVYSVQHGHGMEDTIDDFRQEVSERIEANRLG